MAEKEIKRLTIAINASDYIYQGPRFVRLGPNSGELFRNEILIPFLERINDGEGAIIDFDGTRIYSPSFLEESFGGAIRAGYGDKIKQLKFENIPGEWRKALESYIDTAIKTKRK